MISGEIVIFTLKIYVTNSYRNELQVHKLQVHLKILIRGLDKL